MEDLKGSFAYGNVIQIVKVISGTPICHCDPGQVFRVEPLRLENFDTDLSGGMCTKVLLQDAAVLLQEIPSPLPEVPLLQ